MRSLAGVATRTLRRSARRYVLTAVGAALGVAVLFAILVTSAASRDALREAVDGQTGRADVVVSPAGAIDALLPAGSADAVRALDGVELAVATVGFRSVVTPPGLDADVGDPESIRERTVFVNGVGDDFTAVNTLPVADGRQPEADAPEVAVPRRLADSLDLAVGDQVEVATPTAPAMVTVVGILDDRGAATANQGDVLYTSRGFARTALGASDGISGIQVVLERDVDAADWIDANRAALPGMAIQDASDVAADFAQFITGVSNALTLVAVVAVFIGGFLVYLTFSVAVAERTRVLGTLRALGATAGRVRRLVVVEAAVLGAGCAVVGLGVGYGLASLAMGVVGSLLELDLGRVGAPVGSAVLSLAVGTGVAAVAALGPARRAAGIEPVSAMRGGALAIERPPRRWLGPVLLVVGAALNLSAGGVAISGLALLVVLTGAVLSVRLAIGPVARLIGAGTTRLAVGTGDIAVRHLERERTRSAFTLALVMVALAMTLSVAAANTSMADGLDRVLDRQARAIQVFAPGALDSDAAADVAAVPGVGTVSPLRFGTIDLGAAGDEASMTTTFIQVIDPTTYFEVASFPYVEGDDRSVKAALAAGGGVVLPAPEANRIGVETGEEVQIGTRDGAQTFRVAGVYDVVGGGFGAVLGAPDLERIGAGRVNGFLVGTDGADVEQVAAAIRERVAGERQLVVDSPADARAYAEDQVAGFFGIAYAILVVALGVSLLGLANTLVVAILDRTREIGVLRSTGARRAQIRRMVTVEATTMALVAFVLSVPLAALLAYGIIDAQLATIAGGLDYVFPWNLLLPLAVITIVVAALASVLPARRASRLEIVDALRFE
jgi:putative ABC transport system permease protein